MCFPEENQQPILGVTVFPKNGQISLDVKQKHTFYKRKATVTIIILFE